MQRYANYGGNSGIYAFEVSSGQIDIQFNTGAIYSYSYNIPGANSVEEMKRLAYAGRGLNTYISKYIKKNYAGRIR